MAFAFFSGNLVGLSAAFDEISRSFAIFSLSFLPMARRRKIALS